MASLFEEYGPFETRLYDDKETQWLDLEAGRINCMTEGVVSSGQRMEQNPNIQVIASNPETYPIACALRKGDPLKAELDKAIQAMKADGTTKAIFEEMV